MNDIELLEPWIQLAELAQRGSRQEVGRFLDGLSPRDVALAISRLSEEEQTQVLTSLDPEQAAETPIWGWWSASRCA
jgi:Mg/Co/Ni transporter MgtE